MNPNLKLFVWRGPNVLQSYSGGLIVALAETFEQAIQSVEEELGYPNLKREPEVGEDPEYLFPPQQYEVLEEPAAFVCWGGD